MVSIRQGIEACSSNQASAFSACAEKPQYGIHDDRLNVLALYREQGALIQPSIAKHAYRLPQGFIFKSADRGELC